MRRLVIRPGAIGDCIVSLPAIEHLEPSEIWAPAQNLPLVRHIAPAVALSLTGLDLLELDGQSDMAAQRLQRFDEIISWYGSAREEFRDVVTQLPFRFFPALPGNEGSEHSVDFYAKQVGLAPGAIPCLPWRAEKKGFVVIHPFSGSRKKNWPLEQFREAARSLPLPGEWCAGPEEVLDEARRFDDLGALGEWLATAALFIGNDSGISHLAAACGVPTVAVFTETNPAVWAPRGEKVTVLWRPAVSEVVQAATRLL